VTPCSPVDDTNVSHEKLCWRSQITKLSHTQYDAVIQYFFRRNLMPLSPPHYMQSHPGFMRFIPKTCFMPASCLDLTWFLPKISLRDAYYPEHLILFYRNWRPLYLISLLHNIYSILSPLKAISYREFVLLNSTEHSPSREANSRWNSHEIPGFLWNLNRPSPTWKWAVAYVRQLGVKCLVPNSHTLFQ
jgi:hypothetical protein